MRAPRKPRAPRAKRVTRIAKYNPDLEPLHMSARRATHRAQVAAYRKACKDWNQQLAKQGLSMAKLGLGKEADSLVFTIK